MTYAQKKRGTYLPMKSAILRSLMIGGVLRIAVLAPKTTLLLKKLDRGASRRKNLYRSIDGAIANLKRSGHISVTGIGANREVELTKKGTDALDAIYAHEYRIPEPAFWDGKWRIVMFDMTERRKRYRDRLRLLLRGAGFIELQHSVWVHPFPCDEFAQIVRAHLRSGTGELRCFVAESLESDKQLRAHFGLL